MDYRGYFGPGQFLVSNTLWLPRNLIELTGFCDVDLWSPAKTKSFFCGVLNGRKPFKVN
jgi:hypothetical protein